MKKYKIAVLDDYQNVALESADWSVLRDRADHRPYFRDHLADPDAVIGEVCCLLMSFVSCASGPPPAPQRHLSGLPQSQAYRPRPDQ